MSGWQIGLLILVGIWFLTRGIPQLIEAYKEMEDRRKDARRINDLWDKLENLGYAVGKAELPPTIPSDLESSLTPFDKIVFMNGWERGYKEFSKSQKRAR